MSFNIRKMEYALIGDNLVGRLLEMMQKFRRDDSISTVSFASLYYGLI